MIHVEALTNTPIPHDGYEGCGGAHLSVTEIELCNDYLEASWQQQMEGELAAERAIERHYEDRGYWDAREQEDVEAARGVISFEDAYAHALGYADAGEREWALETGADLGVWVR